MTNIYNSNNVSIFGDILKSKINDNANISPDPLSNIWASIANGYLNNEIETIKEDVFISRIKLFPLITKEIITNFKKHQSDLFLEYKLNVSIYSSMLPKHFSNFPHRIEFYNTEESASKKFPRFLLYEESYVKDYNDDIKKIIDDCNSSENLMIHRHTLVTFGANTFSELVELSAAYKNNPIFPIEELISDFHLINRTDEEKLNNLKDEGYKDVSEFCCGLKYNELSSYINTINKHIKEKKAYIFNYDKRNYPFDNIVCHFINSWHSKGGAHLNIISELTKFNRKENEIGTLFNKKISNENIVAINEIKDINPDFIEFKLIPKSQSSEYKEHEMFLVAKINLEEDTVVIRILSDGSQLNNIKEEFIKYKNVAEILTQKAIDFRAELGESFLLKEFVKERIDNIKENNSIEFKDTTGSFANYDQIIEAFYKYYDSKSLEVRLEIVRKFRSLNINDIEDDAFLNAILENID